MSHTYGPGKTGLYYNYNSDLSGDIRIVYPDKSETGVPGEDMVALVASVIRNQHIAKLEQLSDKDLLIKFYYGLFHPEK
jgi:hypothetical protein